MIPEVPTPDPSRLIKLVTDCSKLVMILIMGICVTLLNTVEFNSADNCPGFRQEVAIPQGYDKNVPDAYYTENVTHVFFNFSIKQIKDVVTERWV